MVCVGVYVIVPVAFSLFQMCVCVCLDCYWLCVVVRFVCGCDLCNVCVCVFSCVFCVNYIVRGCMVFCMSFVLCLCVSLPSC